MSLKRQITTDEDGAAALEFALIAAPFFMLLFGILEVALIFFGSALLDRAVEDAARDIRTGEMSSLSASETDFSNQICANIDLIMDCDRLELDVRPMDSFSSVDFNIAMDDDGELDTGDFGFDTGGSEDVIFVRAYYEWQLFGPGLVNGMSNMDENRRLIVSTTAFKNEPF